MPLHYRIILGCLALVGAGFTLRALRTGIIYGRDSKPYNRDNQFGEYAARVFGGLVGTAILSWLAAGYTLDDFLAPFGLSGLFR